MKIKKDMHHIHDKSYKDLFSNKESFGRKMIQNFIESPWGKEITEDNMGVSKISLYILSDYESLGIRYSL